MQSLLTRSLAVRMDLESCVLYLILNVFLLFLLQKGLRIPRSAASVRALSSVASNDVFKPCDKFLSRHVGSHGIVKDRQTMLDTVGFPTLDALVDSTVPTGIRLKNELKMEAPLSESEALEKLKTIMSENKVYKSFIGMGYYETLTPGVILRNVSLRYLIFSVFHQHFFSSQVLENPGWYTAYTPYQAEISQGRLQSLLNFQTMVTDLTGMALSNASLLDEATAAAEAMSMCFSLKSQKKLKFFVDDRCHPQNIALVQTRGTALGLQIEVGNVEKDLDLSKKDYCGVMVQYPDTYGKLFVFALMVWTCAVITG